MTPESTRAVYVRMSERLASKLDKATERLGVSKRDVLSRLVDDHLDLEGANLVIRMRNGSSSASDNEAANPGGEVLTLEEAAALLRVPPADVLTLIEAGDIPARLVGGQWRLARGAVLDWLRGEGLSGAPDSRA